MKIKWRKIIKFGWFKRLYILYIFGFVINFRPSTPFFYEFLISNDLKGFSQNETSRSIFPVLFYSTAVQALPVFLLTDFLRYIPIMVLTPLAGIIATCFYIWTESATKIKIGQGFSGTIAAAEVAYYASVYAHGDEKNYQILTALVRAAPLLGKTISNLLAQLLTYYNYLDYQQLYYFDLAAFIIAALLLPFLPRQPKPSEKDETTHRNFTKIFSTFRHSYPNKYVVKWSIWSIFALCGYNQVVINVQRFWKAGGVPEYGGVIEGSYGFLTSIATILGGFAVFNWKFNGDLLLSMVSLVQAFMMLFMSQFENNILNAFFYVVFGFAHHFIVTVLNAEMAKFLKKGTFGFVFGFIAFMSAVAGCGVTLLLNDNVGFKTDIFTTFMVYGYFYLALAVTFIVVGLVYWFAKHTYDIE